jgi:hypothetical protein
MHLLPILGKRVLELGDELVAPTGFSPHRKAPQRTTGEAQLLEVGTARGALLHVTLEAHPQVGRESAIEGISDVIDRLVTVHTTSPASRDPSGTVTAPA